MNRFRAICNFYVKCNNPVVRSLNLIQFKTISYSTIFLFILELAQICTFRLLVNSSLTFFRFIITLEILDFWLHISTICNVNLNWKDFVNHNFSQSFVLMYLRFEISLCLLLWFWKTSVLTHVMLVSNETVNIINNPRIAPHISMCHEYWA